MAVCSLVASKHHCSWLLTFTQGLSTIPPRDKIQKQMKKKDCSSWNHLWLFNTLATSCEKLTHWKRLWCWQGLGAGGKGDNRGWDGWMAHQLDGREFGWTPGVGDGQGGLECRDSWDLNESDTTERLNWTELNWTLWE